MRGITVILVLSLCAGGCGDDAAHVVLGPEDSGSTIDVLIGSVVVVELESNPSTGFSWVVPDGLSVLELRKERWVGGADTTGSPGTTHLELAVVASGSETLRLEYRRPWLPDEPADRTFTVTVVSR